jgi:hypothetical protein
MSFLLRSFTEVIQIEWNRCLTMPIFYGGDANLTNESDRVTNQRQLAMLCEGGDGPDYDGDRRARHKSTLRPAAT